MKIFEYSEGKCDVFEMFYVTIKKKKNCVHARWGKKKKEKNDHKIASTRFLSTRGKEIFLICLALCGMFLCCKHSKT